MCGFELIAHLSQYSTFVITGNGIVLEEISEAQYRDFERHTKGAYAPLPTGGVAHARRE